MKKIMTIFWLLIVLFLFILGQFFIPAMENFFRGLMFLLPLILFSLSGGLLLFYALKLEKGKKDRKFFTLTGASALGFFVFVFLHNGFYALAVISAKVAVLRGILEFLHATFFIIATILCPLGFLVGAIGVIILLIRGKK